MLSPPPSPTAKQVADITTQPARAGPIASPDKSPTFKCLQERPGSPELKAGTSLTLSGRGMTFIY